MKFKGLSLILICLCFLILFQNEDVRFLISPKLHEPFINYTPYWFSSEIENQKRVNFTWVKKDLDLVKELGFKGIKLWCIEGLEQRNLTVKLFDYCSEIELKIILPFRIWRPEQFPNNLTAINEFKDFLRDLIPKIKNKSALYFYVVHYPIDFSNPYNYAKTWFDNETYKFRLREIISLIRELDCNHDIYMALEFNPYWNPPLDLGNIKGYGVEPYSWHTPYNFDVHRIVDFVKYFEDKGLSVYIDEYGLHTNNLVTHGYCVNETVKTEILETFIKWIFDKPYIWSYFSLHDTNEADWGLAYANNTLKPSGEMVKSLLPKITHYG